MPVPIDQPSVLRRLWKMYDEGNLQFNVPIMEDHVVRELYNRMSLSSKADLKSLKKVVKNLVDRDKVPRTYGFLRSFDTDVSEDRISPELAPLIKNFPQSWREMAVGIHSFLQSTHYFKPDFRYGLKWRYDMDRNVYGKMAYSRATEFCEIWLNAKEITTPFIFRQIFLHELCHVQVFRNLGGEIQQHGRKWRKCVENLRTEYPYLEEIPVNPEFPVCLFRV